MTKSPRQAGSLQVCNSQPSLKSPDPAGCKHPIPYHIKLPHSEYVFTEKKQKANMVHAQHEISALLGSPAP